MAQLDCKEIGQRIKMLRNRKGLNQKELAEILGKSLRTIQKYETGEIEVSISTVNHLADILDSTSTYILGYETNRQPIQSLSDIMSFLFELDKVMDISFDVEIAKPPRSTDWKCSISFNGKAAADYNADLCLFLEDWQEQREDVQTYKSSLSAYKKWQEQTLAYYAANSVETREPEELSEEERIAKRNEYLKNL